MEEINLSEENIKRIKNDPDFSSVIQVMKLSIEERNAKILNLESQLERGQVKYKELEEIHDRTMEEIDFSKNWMSSESHNFSVENHECGECINLQKQSEELDSRIADLTVELSRQREVNSQYYKTMNELKENIENREQESVNTLKENNSLKKEVENLNQSLNTNQEDLKCTISLVDQLKISVKNREDEKVETSKLISELRDKYESQTKTLKSQLQEERDTIMKSNENLVTKLQTLSEKVEELEVENQCLKNNQVFEPIDLANSYQNFNKGLDEQSFFQSQNNICLTQLDSFYEKQGKNMNDNSVNSSALLSSTSDKKDLTLRDRSFNNQNLEIESRTTLRKGSTNHSYIRNCKRNIENVDPRKNINFSTNKIREVMKDSSTKKSIISMAKSIKNYNKVKTNLESKFKKIETCSLSERKSHGSIKGKDISCCGTQEEQCTLIQLNII